MRVLIVFHGWLPDAERPSSGGAIRAWNHGEALRAAGHEVVYATREQDATPGGPLTYASPRHLKRLAETVAPDRVLCVQPEEAPALRLDGVPLCVDLYAPRLLEAAWQDGVAQESVHTLRAIAAGDHFLFSNSRQRWLYLGLLALAGVDVREQSGSVVPLVAPHRRRGRLPRSPVLVMGGVSWPWQDPTDALRRTVAWLDARGEGVVWVVGGRPAVGDCEVVDLPAAVPAGERLKYLEPVSYDALLTLYGKASVALDRMAPNPEREVALAFRHVDYLGAGLPLITGAGHPLSDRIAETGAGWVGGELEAALEQAFGDPAELKARRKAAHALSRSDFSRDVAEQPLVRWVEEARVREHRQAPLPERAQLVAALAASRARASHAVALRDKAEAEVATKRRELSGLNAQIQALTATTERLARTLDEVAGFKREAVRVLGSERDAASEEAKALVRENADLAADVAKKDAELRAARRELDRLNDALTAAQDDARYSGDRLTEAGRREDSLRQQRDAAEARSRQGLLSRLLGSKD